MTITEVVDLFDERGLRNRVRVEDSSGFDSVFSTESLQPRVGAEETGIVDYLVC